MKITPCGPPPENTKVSKLGMLGTHVSDDGLGDEGLVMFNNTHHRPDTCAGRSDLQFTRFFVVLVGRCPRARLRQEFVASKAFDMKRSFKFLTLNPCNHPTPIPNRSSSASCAWIWETYLFPRSGVLVSTLAMEDSMETASGSDCEGVEKKS